MKKLNLSLIIYFFILPFFMPLLNSIEAQTIDSIVINPKTVPILTPDDNPITIIATAIDQTGDTLPNEPLNWTNDSTLVDFNFNINSDKIIFDPHNASISQNGWVRVTSLNDSTIWNRIFFQINVKSTVTHAFTRDFNGNGFLDAIELIFDKEFIIPSGYTTDDIVIENINPLKLFTIDSLISGNPGGKTKTFFLFLNEDDSKVTNIPQTSWRPIIEINDLDSIHNINATCTDGAGPIVWTAMKTVKDKYDRTKDEITLTFSEDIYHSSGASFLSADPKPSEIFNIWNALDTIKIDSMLHGINLFEDQQNSWVIFNMKNGNNLNANHIISIEPSSYLADYYGNLPIQKNRKARILVKGQIGDIIYGPSYVYPTYEFYENEKDLPIPALNNKEALIRVTDFGGTFAAINIIPYQDSIINCTGKFVIHDMNGFIILQKEIKIETTNVYDVQSYNLYWDGLNNNGKKAREGTHYVAIQINNCNKTSNAHGTWYVKNKAPYKNNENSFCGSGIGLALIPPLCFRYSRKLKKRKSKR